MRAVVESHGSGLRRTLQTIVLLCPALTVAVKGGANGSLLVAAALSLMALVRQRSSGQGSAVDRPNGLLRAYAFAMAAPVLVLASVQTMHGATWAVGAISSSARFLLAVPVALVTWRIGRAMVPWADTSFALGAMAAGVVMAFLPREWSPDRWGSSFLDPIISAGLGLEQNAVVMVLQPDKGNAWVNVGYAGFIGSVTAMNEKKVTIGEMGGRGEGNWDGKPMAQLMREVMEKANTLEEAVEIMRKGPRTCEYYYVISDAKSQRAVGIAATPTKFEVVLPGQSHPQLPHPIEDAVLMSAGDRYEELAKRVKGGYGRFDAEKSRDLMKRPLCMTSNIHCALFAPDTLDFWVANADSESVAAHARYTRYNLRELLVEPKVQ